MVGESDGTTSRYERFAGRWSGTNGFRLMPEDALYVGGATAQAATAATGHDLVLTYTWVHPDDGPQEGVMLVGSPDDDGHLTVAWGDGWHQKPAILVLTGTATEHGFEVIADYGSGWKWMISLSGGDERLDLLMHNVVPPEYASSRASAGPYPVMVTELRPA